jgi:hypothetical protein
VVIDAGGEIFGDVPNVSARAQGLAEPGAVVVTARVQRQVAGLFVAEERGSHALKGVPEPVTLYQIVRASGGGRRAGQRYLTPLVGREEEIAMLMRRWERARQGNGQLVLIVGEPGLGKSRLIDFMPGCARCRIPGSNGTARNYYRTHRCIRLQSGAAYGLAAPRCRRNGGLQIWRTLSR